MDSTSEPALPPHGPAGRLNAMSVDVEDYFHAEALISIREQAGSAAVPERFVQSTDRMLDLFAAHNIKATFFTLGWVGERAPDLIRRIVEAGHELGCHSQSHVRVAQQTPEAFRCDIERAKKTLEDAGGAAVRGYRAPTFSITAETWWAYELLIEEGFAYSSSIYPVAHDLYGFPGAPRGPFRPERDSSFMEIPMSTTTVRGRVVQGGGGGYFRLLPYGLSARIIRAINGADERPFMFYCHPWEIDAGQPRQAGLPLRSKLRHYTNLGRMEKKLDRLLGDFNWGRVDEVFCRSEGIGPALHWSPEEGAGEI